MDSQTDRTVATHVSLEILSSPLEKESEFGTGEQKLCFEAVMNLAV